LQIAIERGLSNSYNKRHAGEQGNPLDQEWRAKAPEGGDHCCNGRAKSKARNLHSAQITDSFALCITTFSDDDPQRGWHKDPVTKAKHHTSQNKLPEIVG
jgi:hypothetical protein